jgi:transposase
MFIRQTKKQRSGSSKIYYQFSLVQSVRIDGKSRQRTILYLGSDEELRDKTNRKLVLEALKGMISGSPSLFDDIPGSLLKLAKDYYQKYLVKYEGASNPIATPPKTDDRAYREVATDHVEVGGNKSFGPEHLCLQVLDKLKLGSFLSELGLGKDDAGRALISIAARAIYTASEHKTADILKINSSLTECMGCREPITHKQLYRIADILYKNKQAIDRYLYNHITNIFGITDSIVIFDISNTYFESPKTSSELAAYGRSNQKRGEGPIVVFTGVINAEGFIRHSRIYQGNTPDQQTLSDMVDDLENYSNDSPKTVVIDAGIATDENLEMLDEAGYTYVCVSRSRLKDYPPECLKTHVSQETGRGKRQVNLSVFTPEGYSDTWMLARSEAKKAKEQSMRDKLRDRFEADLRTARAGLGKKGGTKKINKVWERIGRYKERHRRVSGSYHIQVTGKDGTATAIDWTIQDNKGKDDKAEGIYFIRTNLPDPQEGPLWDIYNTIRRVESTFRCLKTDLNIRPIYHQNDGRIQAHLYLAILAYQLVNTIRYLLARAGIHYDWSHIVRIMSTQQVQTVQMPSKTQTIYLRKASKPIKEAKEIYDAVGCHEIKKTLKKYVVSH